MSNSKSKPQQFEIIFGNPKKTYKAGDVVTGSLILHVDQPQRYTSLHLKFSGKASVAFHKGEGKTKRYYMNKARYMKRDVRLLPREGNVSGGSTIEPGHHEFPFSFHLPPDIPSSFESRYGNVRYTVKAKLEMGWNDSMAIRQYFVVFRPLDLNSYDFSWRPLEQEEEMTLCCLCCASGNISARISIPRQGYVPGETIPVHAEVNNNTRTRINKMYFTIEQVSHCYAMGETETNYKTLTTSSVEHPGVAAGSSARWEGQNLVTVPITVPTGLEGCGTIDIEHHLCLNMKPAGLSCDRAVKLKILIGTVPLIQYNTGDTTQPHHRPGHSTHQAGSAPSGCRHHVTRSDRYREATWDSASTQV